MAGAAVWLAMSEGRMHDWLLPQARHRGVLIAQRCSYSGCSGCTPTWCWNTTH